MGNFCCRGEGALTREGLNAAGRAFLDAAQAELRAQSAQLRATAGERFGADRMGRDTEAVYRRLLPSHRPRKYLVAGYAGCGNLGDDAIARRLIERIREQDPAARVSLTVRATDDARHRFKGATLIDRRSPLSLIRAIRRSDVLLLGGGCLLQNCSAHGNRSLTYYLSLAWLSRLCRRPVLLVAAGIGPLRGRFARYMVGRTLRRAAYLSVRDTASRRLALSLGVPPGRVHSEADPVLSLTPASKEAGKAFLERHLPKGTLGLRYLCIPPRRGGLDEQALTRALTRLYEKEQIYPLFLAFDWEKDTPICDRLIAGCGAGTRLPANDEALVAALFSLDEVVGVAAGRLHALILSQVGGKAAVALIGNGCDSKVAGFAGSVGFGMLPAQATARQILTALRELFNHRDE
jgi:polysaccharide pyruvyl transferase CsaB